MSQRFPRISVLGLILCLAPGAGAQTNAPPAPAGPAWPVASAPARFTVEVDKNRRPSGLTWVNLELPDPRWGSLPLRVFTDAGAAVGSEVLWSAPGEPLTLVFDSSSNADRYQIYLGSDWPPLPLKDDRQGVMLESRTSDGKTIDHLPDMLEAWNKSTTVNGRAIVPTIWEGGNRFGPQGNLLEHFRGWFDVAAAEHLELVTMSNDASFVLVDGKEVVEWPGKHDLGPGYHGEFHGAVDLGAGRHVIDDYNAYVSAKEGRPLMVCLAAKGGPLEQWTMLTPDKNFFSPANEAQISDYMLQTGRATAPLGGTVPMFAFEAKAASQSVIAPDVPDIGLISLRLGSLGRGGGDTASWTFDDGTTAQGPGIDHLFPRPGLRAIRMTVNHGPIELGSVTETIRVHANWSDNAEPHLDPAAQSDILARDPATLTASDLASCVAVFEVFKSSDAVLKLLPSVGAKMKEIQDADLPYVKDAALLLAPDLTHASESGQLLQALIDRCSPAVAPSPLVALASESRLALAQVTLATTDHLDEVRALLGAVNVPLLSGDEHRSFDLLRADLALAAGDLAAARKQYQDLTGEPSGPDARSSIRRTAQVSHARVFLDRKDDEAAEDALDEVAGQAPIEKMATDWALTRLRLYEDQKLPGVALLWAKRLLPVVGESGRSELLFRLTDLAYQAGDRTLADKTLAELLKKHPYSQEAAEAKAKWPSSL